MESNTECPRTPRLTRRTSVQGTEPTSQAKRSVRKTVLKEIQEVEEKTNELPKTPSRSSRALEFQTPSRSEALADAQTPRRSVRKSVKPVQEYENIVAQKGLTIKRAASSSVEDVEESNESKWEPAVIGRVSSKRSKKAKRAKNKKLKRQPRIEDDENRNDDHEQEDDELEGVKEEVADGSSLHDECPSIPEEDPANEVAPSVIDDDEKGENNLKLETSPSEVPTMENADKPLVVKDEAAEESDVSLADGDTELAAIPVTADDFIDEPETEPAIEIIKLQVTEDDSEEVPDIALPATEAVFSNSKADDSDCIMISLNESSHTEQSECETEKSAEPEPKSMHDSVASTETNMPSLLLSDDEEEAVKHTIKEEPPMPDQVEESTNLNSTFDADEPALTLNNINEESELHTPVLRPSTGRTPTPFKSNKAVIPDIIVEPEDEAESDQPPEVIVELRDAGLKSSRKRSFSICTDRPKKMVTFHSPANTTVAIYDGDLMKSAKKESSKGKNVTQRRKRSLSVTETEKEMIAYFKDRKTTEETPNKQKKQSQPGSRTKMPNFAAIHQYHFQRMESISDHIARKAERAKVLSNSATKIRPASIQKGLPVKNSILRDFHKEGIFNKSGLPVPKARHRIELSGIEHKPKIFRSKSKQDLSAMDDLPSIGKIPSKMNINFGLPDPTKPSLPKPTAQSLATAKITTSLKATASTSNTTISTITHTQSTAPDSRPRFNLSTAIDSSQVVPKAGDRLNDRRKRLMDMYKSRSAPRAGERNKEILKGVRTNRRFELQMMCRNRPN